MLIDFTKMDKRISRLTNKEIRMLMSIYNEVLGNIKKEIGSAYARYGGDWQQINKYNRLQRLQESIEAEMALLSQRTSLKLRGSVKEIYKASYYTSGFEIENTIGMKLGFGVLDPETVQASIENPLDSVGFVNRNRDNVMTLRNQLKQEITSGMARGISYTDMAQNIDYRFRVGRYNAERIARTEGHRVQLKGREDGLYQAASYGVEMKKRWRSALDSRTRSAHRTLDGREVDLDENFKSPAGGVGPRPGAMGTAKDDIHCRCGIDGVVDGYKPDFRRARNRAEERGELIRYKTYKEWEKERIA